MDVYDAKKKKAGTITFKTEYIGDGDGGAASAAPAKVAPKVDPKAAAPVKKEEKKAAAPAPAKKEEKKVADPAAAKKEEKKAPAAAPKKEEKKAPAAAPKKEEKKAADPKKVEPAKPAPAAKPGGEKKAAGGVDPSLG